MGRVARGDAAAQRQLTQRLVRRVEGLCRAVLRGCGDALYARQLSMLEILESAHAFRGASSLERWADRISVRTALRVASERRARGVPFDREDDSADATIEVVLLERQYLDHVSEQERMVIVLRHRLAYSIEEIVDLTGIAEKEVKASLLHARSVLRRMCRKGQLLVDASSSKAVG